MLTCVNDASYFFRYLLEISQCGTIGSLCLTDGFLYVLDTTLLVLNAQDEKTIIDVTSSLNPNLQFIVGLGFGVEIRSSMELSIGPVKQPFFLVSLTWIS